MKDRHELLTKNNHIKQKLKLKFHEVKDLEISNIAGELDVFLIIILYD